VRIWKTSQVVGSNFTAVAGKKPLQLKEKGKGTIMDKIIELPFAQEGFRCWMCHEGLSCRARFCNHCGCIQPVRQIDHFQRLGLPRSVDIDRGMMDKHFQSLMRSFSAERFVIRSHAEKTYAAKHREVLQEAYDTLRDTVRRSRYWIELHAEENKEDISTRASNESGLVAELQAVLDAAEEAVECDRLARRAGQEIEQGIMKLLGSLRKQDWHGANAILGTLDGLETLIVDVRQKRQSLTPQVAK
jgi:molecular chaperone HscB